MIKKIKIGLLISALALFAFAGYVYATGDLIYSSDTTVTIGVNNYTIGTGSEATSVVVDSTTLTVTVPSGSQFMFSSPNRYALNNNQSVIQSCSNAANTITITGPLTVIVTPDATTTCTLGGSGTLVSGGGGGGGGGSVTTTTTTTTTTPALTVTNVAPTTTTSIPGCTSNIGFSTTTGASCAGNTTITTTTTPTIIAGCGNRTTGFSTATGVSCAGNAVANMSEIKTAYNFGKLVMKNGSNGESVKELQKFLNDKLGLKLTADGKLGAKTVAAIKKWQKENGLKADGIVGPKTRALMEKSE